MKLHLSIITPSQVIYQGEVDEVIIPTEEGIIGVLPEHTPLLSKLVPGELEIKTKGQSQHLAVTGGFIEVSNNQLTILADYAIHAQDINITKAEEAKKRAEKLMSEKVGDIDYAEIEKEFVRAIAELKVARHYKPK